MSGSRIVIDGLWRCLCPSIDTPALTRAIRTPFPPTARTTRASVRVSRSSQARAGSSKTTQLDSLYEAEPHRWASDGQSDATLSVGGPSRSPSTLDGLDLVFQPRSPPEAAVAAEAPPSPSGPPHEYGPIDESIVVGKLLANNYHQSLKYAPTAVIYEAMGALRHRSSSFVKIKEFARHLVDDRGVKMNGQIFGALVAANWDTAGAGADVWDIASNMQKERVHKSANFYHNALQSLAIHPNYLLRNQLLREMKAKWMELSPEGQGAVALGLLRDKQYELAYEKLDHMIQERAPIPPWVFDIFIYHFTHLGFIREAFAILQRQRQIADQSRVSLNVLYFLLDAASRALDYEVTRGVWSEMVDTQILNPSDGITLNALNTFSRHGDVELATRAIQHLSSRGIKLGTHHYEALVDCYIVGEDLTNALQVLCIMGAAGFRSDRSTTRSIYRLLKRSPEQLTTAVDTLFGLSEKHQIPIAAFNVVIEALCQVGDASKAVNLYQHVRQLCRTGPNLETFEHLLAGHPRAEMVDFLLAEMASFSVQLTHGIRDNVVCSYAQDAECSLDVAFSALRDIEDDSFRTGKHFVWISKPTLVALVERCFKDEDARVWHLVDSGRLRSLDIEDEVRRLSAKWDPAIPPASAGAGHATSG